MNDYIVDELHYLQTKLFEEVLRSVLKGDIMILRRGAIMHDAHCGSMVFTHEVVPTLSAGLRAGAHTQRPATAPVTPVVRRPIAVKCRFMNMQVMTTGRTGIYN